MMGAGNFDTPMTLSAPSVSLAPTGNDETVYLPQAVVWAQVRPQSVAATPEAGRLQETTIYAVRLRYRSDVLPGWLLEVGPLRLRVETVVDPDQRTRVLDLTCRQLEEAS